MFERYVDDGLKFVTRKCIQAIPQVDISKVTTLCSLLESLAFQKDAVPDPKMDAVKLHPLLCTVFTFCYVWSIGGNLVENSQDAYDSFLRELFQDNNDVRVRQ